MELLDTFSEKGFLVKEIVKEMTVKKSPRGFQAFCLEDNYRVIAVLLLEVAGYNKLVEPMGVEPTTS